MVTKVIINNNQDTPFRYVSDVFENNTEFTFKEGVNIIVGKNGCGKSTLLDLIKTYLLVDYTECGKGLYNCRLTRLFNKIVNREIYKGVDVYADYDLNTFCLSDIEEKSHDQCIKTGDDISLYMESSHSSTGEKLLSNLGYLFNSMFSEKANLKFDYNSIMEEYKDYKDYILSHRIDSKKTWTILMDEPDRNLDLKNINQIKGILDYKKENTQIIAVIHNPLLIYSLSKIDHINWIEMTRHYIRDVKKEVDNLIKK